VGVLAVLVLLAVALDVPAAVLVAAGPLVTVAVTVLVDPPQAASAHAATAARTARTPLMV
jgi:hypothetical protein